MAAYSISLSTAKRDYDAALQKIQSESIQRQTEILAHRSGLSTDSFHPNYILSLPSEAKEELLKKIRAVKNEIGALCKQHLNTDYLCIGWELCEAITSPAKPLFLDSIHRFLEKVLEEENLPYAIRRTDDKWGTVIKIYGTRYGNACQYAGDDDYLNPPILSLHRWKGLQARCEAVLTHKDIDSYYDNHHDIDCFQSVTSEVLSILDRQQITDIKIIMLTHKGPVYMGRYMNWDFQVMKEAERLAIEPVSYTHLTLPTNREV